jgi:hypothetical protein
MSPTIQGVCADCWGSKGGRQFWVRRSHGSPSYLENLFGIDPLWPIAFALVVLLPVAALVVLWILA